jgi:hypothetical protein
MVAGSKTGYRDHPVKEIIRQRWCKPLLAEVVASFGKKLVYLGLPGIEALDVKAWINFIDKVIAFQCYDYSKRKSKRRDDVEKLNALLNDLDRQEIISDYSLYEGFMEEVVLRGIDGKTTPFVLGNIITLYNLDFCSTLTSPMNLPDDKGEYHSYFKLQMINKLLEIQRDFESTSVTKRFIMFITVHSDIVKDDMDKHLQREEFDSVRHQIDHIRATLTGKEQEIRILRLYAYHFLKTHFCSRYFSPEFLPTIFYKGEGFYTKDGVDYDNWMLTFTVLGSYEQDPSGSANFYQSMDTCLRSKFLLADETGITLLSDDAIMEEDVFFDPAESFKNSYTVNNLWVASSV